VKIVRRKDGGVTVLECSGHLTMNDGKSELRDRFRELVQDGERQVLMDFRGLTRMDSVGLGEVVACWKRAREVGGVVKFVLTPGDRPARLFTITGLDRIFERFSDPESALAAF